MSGAFWIVELVLELTGATRYFRRRLWLLFSLLGFRAAADILSLILALRYGPDIASSAAWVCEGIQYVLLCALACRLVAMMARDHQDLVPPVLILGSLGAFITRYAFDQSPALTEKLIHAEIAASMFVAFVVGVGWITRKENLHGRCRGVAAGLLISLLGNATCAIAWKFWHAGAQLYPVPAIAALAVWNWSARAGDQKIMPALEEQSWPDLEMIRKYQEEEGPPKKEPQSVGQYRMVSRMVQ